MAFNRQPVYGQPVDGQLNSPFTSQAYRDTLVQDALAGSVLSQGQLVNALSLKVEVLEKRIIFLHVILCMLLFRFIKKDVFDFINKIREAKVKEKMELDGSNVSNKGA